MSRTKLMEIIINEDKCVGCRICQLICSSLYQKKFAPHEAYIQIKDAYELKPQILFLEGCNHCGQCARHCLYGALTIKEAEE
ncbi:MAG: 4Fe-4S dicluster domain-containing protein [Candidatus Hermodarchaeota archaeon]